MALQSPDAPWPLTGSEPPWQSLNLICKIRLENQTRLQSRGLTAMIMTTRGSCKLGILVHTNRYVAPERDCIAVIQVQQSQEVLDQPVTRIIGLKMHSLTMHIGFCNTFRVLVKEGL